MARPADTTEAAWQTQRAILRRMTGAERVAMAFEMSDTARALTEAGIRHRHPDWTDEQVSNELLTRSLGRNLSTEVRGAPAMLDDGPLLGREQEVVALGGCRRRYDDDASSAGADA